MFCTKCGTLLEKYCVPAEQYLKPLSAEASDAYDTITGEKQWQRVYKCPKKRFWNSHDDFGAGAPFTKPIKKDLCSK